ncbi:PaaX family transcriptional regulator [Paeniglutamicibacter psychrophenolicus]|uniref:PaaX family transcriptional regulator n=1 Tax=Paeniglutamicibacter psychrophenolicus TaxID=257454 RepID=UPI0027846029|nr:PaaX family transcriptional regulator C-terminal domain-containing protein [Paeniglutamicibacter psychrophenolicus]MDQ0094223.1 phenylacetic acid degradation operon negative regulatory protein [Paeniglutamicibacter psychrophenolicus]
MTTLVGDSKGPRETPVPRHHQLIVSLFGLYARQHGGALAVATIIDLMRDIGVESTGTRSSISRLKKRGVIDSVQVNGRNGYALAPSVIETFIEGDERIFHPRRARIGEQWLLATFTVPESQRNIRHKIRSALVRMGFGSVTPGLWIAPGHLRDAVLAYFNTRGLNEYLEFFMADHVGGADLHKNIGAWWDLPALDALYSDFLEHNRGLLESWVQRDGFDVDPDSDARAFGDYLVLVTQWRRLPYLDPGLPTEFLPRNWNALEAEQLFQQLHVLLAPRAQRHADRAIDDHAVTG